MARRFGTAPTVAVGLAAMSAGFVAASFADQYTSYLSVIFPLTILMGAGLGLIQGPATELLMSNLPEDDMGVGAAVNGVPVVIARKTTHMAGPAAMVL